MGKIYCCAHGCSNFSGKRVNDKIIKLHRFPANAKNRKIWIRRVKNHRQDFQWNEKKLKTARLCSEHFVGNSGPTNEILIPSIFPQKIYKTYTVDDDSLCTPKTKRLVSQSTSSDDMDIEIEPCMLVVHQENPLNTSVHMHDYTGPIELESLNLVDKYCQTEPTIEPVPEITVCCCGKKPCHPQVQQKTRDFGIQTELPDLSVEDLRESDDKVMFFTGFPSFLSLMLIFSHLKPKAELMSYWKGAKTNTQHQRNGTKKSGPNRKLRLIEEFLLVFMRLRLGLLVEDLAQRFKISVSTCSSIWRTWIRLLASEMVPSLMFWPSREAVISNMPDCFKVRYPNTRVILDCTEIRTQTPESTKAKTLLYSNYKSHMTWKVLVGITPSGVPCFISDCFNGSISDKKITDLSGVLDLCEPGDAVMVDKGFLISDMTTERKLHLIIPHFKSKTQFTRRQVEETRRIANLRIHVEREMQRIKSFLILDGVMPICLHDMVSDIFKICAAMTVLYPPLVQN